MHVDTPSFRIPQEEFEDYVEECINACRRVIVTRLDWKAHPPNPEHLCPYLCWQPVMLSSIPLKTPLNGVDTFHTIHIGSHISHNSQQTTSDAAMKL